MAGTTVLLLSSFSARVAQALPHAEADQRGVHCPSNCAGQGQTGLERERVRGDSYKPCQDAGIRVPQILASGKVPEHSIATVFTIARDSDLKKQRACSTAFALTLHRLEVESWGPLSDVPFLVYEFVNTATVEERWLHQM